MGNEYKNERDSGDEWKLGERGKRKNREMINRGMGGVGKGVRESGGVRTGHEL